MSLRPNENSRPAMVVAMLTALAVAVVALSATVWVHFLSADRGYTTELRRSLRKYGGPSAVPRDSVAWLMRVHGRTSDQVLDDLVAAARVPLAFDADTPLHEDPNVLVQFYLDHGFLGLWLAFSCVGLLAGFPLMTFLTRHAQPLRRRHGPE